MTKRTLREISNCCIITECWRQAVNYEWPV